ncbi:LpqN/LpqT family lipoprotein [Candidatus Woesearchaeota archaeon]|nr:LpqN/LpqT family lipoprotein [Candidatus Woesearchaeota archaeon]
MKVFIAILAVAVLIAGCSQSQINPAQNSNAAQNPGEQGFLTHEDTDYKVKISYPSSWELASSGQSIFAMQSPKERADDSFQENINLVMNDLSGQEMDVDSYAKLATDNLAQSIQGFALEESGSTSLAGMPARRIVFTGNVGGRALKFMQVFTIKDGLSYVLTFSSERDAFAENLGLVQKMVDSFEITGSIRELGQGDSGSPGSPMQNQIEEPAQASQFSGKWRVYSERIFYDIGGAGALGIPVSRNLEIKDGSWNFGDSNGKWTVNKITPEDWARWGIESYGPAKKMTLDGWNKGIADGPVEESGGNIDFIWVIYHVEPPQVQNAGTVWIKFGH